MWIVRNALRATLSLRGLGVTVPAGQEFDLDEKLGSRDRAESNNQVIVAFEEGYLENVYKAPRGGTATNAGLAQTGALGGRGLSSEELDDFKKSFMRELREQ